MKKKIVLSIILFFGLMILLTTYSNAETKSWDRLTEYLNGITYREIAETAGGGWDKAGVSNDALENLKTKLNEKFEYDKFYPGDKFYTRTAQGIWDDAKELLGITSSSYIYDISNIYSGSGESIEELNYVWPNFSLVSFDRIRIAIWREKGKNKINLTIICAPYSTKSGNWVDLEVYNFIKEEGDELGTYCVDTDYNQIVTKSSSLKAIINRLLDSWDVLDIDKTIQSATGDYESERDGICKSDIQCEFILNKGDKQKETKYTIKDITYHPKSRLVFYNLQSTKTYNEDGTKKDDNTINNELNNELNKNRNNARKYYSSLSNDEGTKRTETTFTDVLSNPDSYKPTDIEDKDTTQVFNMGKKILGAITAIGIVASVIILALLGIKYILGSIEEKAEIKEGLVPYIIGVVLLTGIPTIVSILYNLGLSFYS